MSEPSNRSVHDMFLAAYDEHADAIFRFCVVKTRNRDLALDLTQETFGKTWEYLSNGNEVENLRAFLYRVARNLIIDHSRKKDASSLDAILDEGVEIEDPHDAAGRMEKQFDAAQALKVLDELDDPYRDVLYMRFIEELDISEIADTLEESPNTVSVRIHRGLKKMEQLLE